MPDLRRISALMQRHERMGWRAPVRRGPGWYAGPFLGFANRMHGDALPSDFNPAPYGAYASQWWTLLSPWFFVVPEENPSNPDLHLHAGTNMRVQTRNFITYLRRGSWEPTPFINQPAPDSNQFSWTWGSYMGVNDWRTESAGNGGGSSHGVLVDGANSLLPHGYGGPPRDIPNPETVTGLAMQMEHRLILDNPAGVDQRSSARLLICLASDLYPFANAPLPEVGYWPANGASGWMQITSSWQTVGFHTYFTGVRPHMYSDTLSVTDTLSLILADPPPGWTDGGGGGGVIIQPPPPATAKRVLFLGDDYIRGDETASGSRSIRGRVIAAMAAAGTPIDAVGRQQLVPVVGGDPDHEGHAGVYMTTTSDNLLARISTIAQVVGSVDAVVMAFGLADYTGAPSGIASRFDTLFGAVRSAFPGADFVPVTLPPRRGLTEAQTNTAFSGYAALNARIRAVAASTYGVTLADGATAALVPADYHSDALLLQSGADKLGTIVADALRAALGVPGSYLVPGAPRRGYVFPAIISGRGRVGPVGNDAEAPAFSTSTLTPGRVGQGYSVTIATTGSPAPTLSVTAGALPAGLSLSGSTISGTPTTAGNFTFTVTAANGVLPNASRQYTIVIQTGPALTTASLPVAIVGVPYSATLTASGDGPLSFVATGLPAGLSLVGASIVGTATTPGVPTVAITPIGPTGPGATVNLPLAVVASSASPAIVTTSLPAGTVGTAYPATPIVLTGTAPIETSIVDGSLPPGLSLLYHGRNINEFADGAAGVGGWTKIDPDSALTVVGGVLRAVATTSDDWAGAWRSIPTTPGTVYRVRVRIASLTGPVYLIARSPTLWPPTTDSTIWITAPGVYEVEHVAETTTIAVGVQSGVSNTAYTIEWDDLTVAPMRRNAIRNAAMVGAAVGVEPTDWDVGPTYDGLTISIVGVGESMPAGAPHPLRYMDIRAQGTTVTTYAFIVGYMVPYIVAASGQTWTLAAYVQNVAGTRPGSRLGLRMLQATAAGAFVDAADASSFSPSLTLATITDALPATTERITAQLFVDGFSAGLAVDFTTRLWMPQLVLGSTLGAWNDPRYPYVAGTPSAAGGYLFSPRADSSIGPPFVRPLSIQINPAGAAQPVASPWARHIR